MTLIWTLIACYCIFPNSAVWSWSLPDRDSLPLSLDKCRVLLWPSVSSFPESLEGQGNSTPVSTIKGQWGEGQIFISHCSFTLVWTLSFGVSFDILERPSLQRYIYICSIWTIQTQIFKNILVHISPINKKQSKCKFAVFIYVYKECQFSHLWIWWF